MLQMQMYIHILRRNWWIILLTAVAAVVAVLGFDLITSPVFRTTTQLLVIPNESLFEGRDLVYSLDTLDKRSIVTTYVEVANSRRILRETMNTLGVEPAEGEQYALSAVALPDANVIEIAVEGPDAGMVEQIANTAAQQTVSFVNQTYDIYLIDILDSALIPSSPISPVPARDAVLALVLGLALGGVLAIVQDQIRHPLKTLQQWRVLDTSSAFTRSYVERYLEDLTQSGMNNLALGLVQLNGLPELQETLPQSLMQRLLRQVTARLRHELRGRDIIGRWNDVSFAVIMPNTSELEAMHTFERLQQTLSQPLKVHEDGEEVWLQPYTGAVVSRSNEPAIVLIEQAEAALSRASLNGSTPVFYSPELTAEASQELTAEPSQVDKEE